MRVSPVRWPRIVALIATLVASCPVYAQRLGITRYSTADGLPAARLSSLAQDAEGYLWFGTSGGLARYDGTEFTTVEAPGETGGDAVIDLVEGGDLGLVVAMRDGLHRVRGNEMRPLPGPGTARWRVRDLTRDDQGTIWIATAGGALRLDPGTEPVELDATAVPGCCSTVIRDGRGRVWAGTDSGLARLQDGRLTSVDAGLEGVGVTVLLEDASGTLWAGTDVGLYRESEGRFRRIATAFGGDVRVLSARRGPDGSVWIGTERGAIRYAGDEQRALTAASGLPGDRISDVLVDREGTLWFATDSGAAKLTGSTFETVTADHGLADDFVVGVLRDESCLWVATRTGLACVGPEGRPWPVELPGLGSASVTAIGRGLGARVLVGTSRGALYRVDRGLATGRRVTRPLRGPVTAILEIGGDLWLGSESGLLVSDGRGMFRRLTEPGSLARATITDVVLDRQGRLWVGTLDAGLYRGQDGRVERVPDDPVDSVAVWDLSADPQAGVWVATNGRGVVHLGGAGGVTRLSRDANGLASDLVQQVVPDAQGRLWIYTNRGLDRWDPGVGVTHYDTGSGLADMTGNPGAGMVDEQGRAWLGTPSGLTVYRPGLAAAREVHPRVVIRRIRLDRRPVPIDGPIEVPYGRGELVFAYTALSYRDEVGTRFQYRLRGRGDGWSRLTEQRQVAYTSLPPGEYVFEVQAISAAGLWSESPATQRVVVVPAFWQTSWFRIGLGGLLLVGLAAVAWGRLRRMEDERRRLRDMVDRRTRELVEKNTLLERMATTDELTGLPNRRFFLESMERELRKMTRLSADQPLSLLVLDLDRFKSINDRYGHAAGDEVLRQVSRRLSQGVRATDLPARYGGEEFAILLPNTDREGAHYLAEKLRGDVESMDVVYGGRRIPVTISVGLATVFGAARYEPEIEEDLLRRADEAMYRAKTSGRNRVVADRAS